MNNEANNEVNDEANSELDADVWRRAGTLFHELVALEPAERSARLSALSGDPVLRRAIDALLAGDAAADERLPAPGFGLFHNDPSADPLHITGRTVSHFLVGEPLAAGGMGIVYRARDLQLHRPVALKFVTSASQPGTVSKERFQREARAAGALDHPNLCPVYEIGESPAGFFLAMPLYTGETLKDRLARTTTIPVDEALAIVRQIAAGLECAHAAGIVHRDIKPGNIMLVSDGTAKILDFGLAKVLAEPAITRGVLGTVSYMSPEQIRGDPVDARTDLWAVGVLLYEMLCGVRPFAGEQEATILHAVLHTVPRRLADLAPDAGRDVDALVGALLEKDPNDRCQGASELVGAIAAVQSGAHLAARRGLRQTVRRFVRRTSRRQLGIAVGVAVVALSALAYVALGNGRSLLAKGMIAERDPLIVADFDVAGSDSTLGPLLANTLGRHLGGSHVVTIMPRGRVESALLRMRRPPGTRLTPAIAREVAQREGARAVVEGDLALLGAGYLVTIRLVAVATGDELASFHATAARPETELLPTLDRLGRSLRREIGESLRDVRADPPLRRLTTTSLEALRLYDAQHGGGPPSSPGQMLVRLRQIVALDSTFAYAWLSIGNTLTNIRYRTTEGDSAFKMMYRLRDRLTPFERAQATAFYWRNVGLDRPQAIDAYEALLARDSLEWRAVLNLGTTYFDAREFARAETLLHRYQRVVGARAAPDLVTALVGQGKLAVAESLLANHERGNPSSRGVLRGRVQIALATLQFDTAWTLAQHALNANIASTDVMDAFAVTLAGIARARGRLTEAHRFDAVADSMNAELLRAARFDPVFAHELSLAAETIWLGRDPGSAVARLDKLFAAHPVRSLSQTQSLMDAIASAALYAAAGRPARAKSIVDTIMQRSDSIAQRAFHSQRYTALAEIALAENRPREAMDLFRRSDVAADGMPATRCAVCTLPGLARASERGGWADSARYYWERYVTTPSLDRLATDQWFLAMAYRRLDALYSAAGNGAKSATYRARLATLTSKADSRR